VNESHIVFRPYKENFYDVYCTSKFCKCFCQFERKPKIK